MNLEFQLHHPHSFVAARQQFGAFGFDVAVGETAFFHHTTGGGVVGEVVTQEGGEALFAEAVFDDGKQCFGANTSVPEGYADPIADFGFVFADGDVACAVRQVADAADGFVGFFPYDGPHSFTMEDGADEL